MAIILSTKIEDIDPESSDGKYSTKNMFAGYAYFAAGLTTGFANLVCGYGYTTHLSCHIMVL